MRIVDLYEEDRYLTDKDKILIWMEKSFHEFDSNLLEIEPDGLVYDGNLMIISHRSIPKLKVQFKKVSGYFYCTNINLNRLEGCPQIVGSNFNFTGTNITSLKFLPKSIEGWVNFENNKIKDPKEYRYALYSEISGKFMSSNDEIDNIINSYKGSENRKHWAYAINLLSKVKL